MIRRPENNFPSYHAHVYFDQGTLDTATIVCKRAGELFDVPVGRFHQKPVGPHPRWSCQLAFDARQFDELVPWLDRNRDGLTILIHGRTGDDVADHTDHASWLGEPVALNLSFFEKSSGHG